MKYILAGGKTGEYFYFMRYKELAPDILTMSKSFGEESLQFHVLQHHKKFLKKATEKFRKALYIQQRIMLLEKSL